MTEKTEWEALRDHAKKRHAARVAKTPARTDYALHTLSRLRERLCLLEMEFEVRNEFTGQIVVKLFDPIFNPCKPTETLVFYSGTGTIQGHEDRGISALVSLILAEERYCGEALEEAGAPVEDIY